MDYLDDIKEEIKVLKQSNKLIIVEGKKDVASLKELGLKNVRQLSGPLFGTIESIEDREIVLLTDLDAEGKKLYSSLKRQLDRRGVKIDNSLRDLLFKTRLSHIEGLSHYLKKNGNI
ncbi:MAG: toprim domain-containing protein [Nanoarchaeota archaeon]